MKNILLVEDNPSDAELTIRSLRKKGLGSNLIHLNDGEEALEYIFATGKYKERNPRELPDLILLDLKMPKVSGLEVLNKVRANELTINIPVVLLTSSKEDFIFLEGDKHKANGYIIKPVEYDSFSEVVTGLGLHALIDDLQQKNS